MMHEVVTSGILAIESSQKAISVAVRDQFGVIVQRIAPGDHREKDLLLPAIISLCADAAITRQDLRAVAVSTGPGGFTGLRVAIATSKGICEALSIPAIDVPSALVAAMGARSSWWPRDREAIVALASKGEESWITHVCADELGNLSVRCASSMTASEFEPREDCVLLADEYLPVALLNGAIEAKMTILPPVFRASDLLVVAEHRFASGDVTDAVALAVRYPREPEAVTLWRRRYPDGFSPKN